MAPRFVEIASSLGRRRATRAGAVLLAAAGLASGSLPLLDQPGYELGEALAILAAVLAPFLGLAAAREERARPGASPLAAWAGASAALVALLAIAFAGALARAALGPCPPLSAATWFVPLLAVPSALVGCALAVAAAFAVGGRRAPAAVLYAVAALSSLALSLAAAYRSAAAFVFDPLLGAWPGPLYDEALAVDLRAVLFRAAALAWAIAIASLAEAAVRLRRATPWALAGPILLAAAAIAGGIGAHGALGTLALSGTREAVAAALGGRREGLRCTIVYPAEKAPAAAAALLSDCEFQHADVAHELGIALPPLVTVFVYRSAEEKRRLVGAASTEYTKPWLGEIHVVDGPLPIRVLRHEMVHAVAAAVARGPLRVPARLGVLVSAGLVEGLAAAIEVPQGRWTVHEWSRAARDLGLLPDIRAIVGPAGFWREPPARAYTAAGSFLAFLLERRGAAPVREAYRTGDVARAFGEPLDALAAEWNQYLSDVPVPPGLAEAARARLSRGSLFARRCAREVASIERRASGAAAAGRTERACALWERAAALSGSARDLEAAGDARARAGDLAGAAAAYRDAARRAPDDAALRGELLADEGDLAWRRGDVAAAKSAWGEALALHPDLAAARLLEAKRIAAADAALGPAARRYLLGEGDPALALARVAAVDHPLSAYLLGRALLARGEAAPAVPLLSRAAGSALPLDLAREAQRLLGEARCASGDPAGGSADLLALVGRPADSVRKPTAGAAPPPDAELARIREALQRCVSAR